MRGKTAVMCGAAGKLTADRRLGHHGGDVLGPVEGDRTSHLHIRGVAPRRKRHHRGIVDDLLRLHLIGHVALGGGWGGTTA